MFSFKVGAFLFGVGISVFATYILIQIDRKLHLPGVALSTRRTVCMDEVGKEKDDKKIHRAEH